jgi:microcystin-dependent protein
MPNDLNSSSWSETDASNNSAPPAGWPAGMFPNQVEPTAQAMMGALKRFWNRINGAYSSTYASGGYVVTPSNTSYPIAYVQGERYSFKANQNSAGGDTLNWNGLGALAIYKPTSTGAAAIGMNDILAGMVDLFYDGTLNGGAGGFWLGTAPGSALGAPSGTVADFAGITAPSGWLLCYGQAISRSTYSALFSVLAISTTGQITSGSPVIPGIPSTAGMAAGMPISGTGIPGSTTISSVDSSTQIHISNNANSGSGSSVAIVVAPHGIGDGATTFNVPDLRGIATFGVDNMGGTAAGRVTAAISGLNGIQLGAAGGSQYLMSHSHAASSAVSDPGHLHGINGQFLASLGSGPGGIATSTGIQVSLESTTNGSGTGISVTTSIGGAGSGLSQNIPPALMLNKIIKT